VGGEKTSREDKNPTDKGQERFGEELSPKGVWEKKKVVKGGSRRGLLIYEKAAEKETKRHGIARKRDVGKRRRYSENSEDA